MYHVASSGAFSHLSVSVTCFVRVCRQYKFEVTPVQEKTYNVELVHVYRHYALSKCKSTLIRLGLEGETERGCESVDVAVGSGVHGWSNDRDRMQPDGFGSPTS